MQGYNQNYHTSTHWHSEMREIDVQEDIKIDNFLTEGCDCRSGLKCCAQFSKDEYRSFRSQWQELEHDNCDMAVMGHLMSCQNLTEELDRSQSHRATKSRERYQVMYWHRGNKVSDLNKS